MAPLAPDECDDVCYEPTDDELSCVNSVDTIPNRPLSAMTSFDDDSNYFDDEPVRHVTFNTAIEIYNVPQLSAYTQEEQDLMWYNNNDFISMKKYRQLVVDTLDKMGNMQTLTDGVEHCTHGVSSTSESIRSKVRVQEAKLAVFTEQQYQWDEDLMDPELVADVYFQATSECQWEALDRGRHHANILERENKKRQVPNKKKKKRSKTAKSPSAAATAKTENCELLGDVKKSQKHDPRGISSKRLNKFLNNHKGTFSTTIADATPDSTTVGLKSRLKEAFRITKTN